MSKRVIAQPGELSGEQLTLLFGLWALVRVLFLLWLPLDARSIDSKRFEIVLAELTAGRNPYVTTSYVNYAPLWAGILAGLGGIADFLGVPVARVLQIAMGGAELLILITLVGVTRSTRAFTVLLWGVALNPAFIFLTYQHNHFDALVALSLLLFTYRFTEFIREQRASDWYWSSFWLGFGIFLKTIPLALLPLFVRGVKILSVRPILTGLALALVPSALGIAGIGWLAPEDVNAKVLMYTSVPGYFGLTGVLGLLGGDTYFGVYRGLFFAAFILSLCGWTIAVREARSFDPRTLLSSTIAILLALICFGPGYGNQYFYWVLPLLVLQLMDEPPASALSRGNILLLITVALTFTVEYSLVPNLGASVAVRFPSETITGWSDVLKSAAALTIVRLPLFVVSLVVLYRQVRDVISRGYR